MTCFNIMDEKIKASFGFDGQAATNNVLHIVFVNAYYSVSCCRILVLCIENILQQKNIEYHERLVRPVFNSVYLFFILAVISNR